MFTRSAVGRTVVVALAVPVACVLGCMKARWVDYQAPDGSFSARFPDASPAIRQVDAGASGRTDYYVFRGQDTFRIQVFDGDRYRPDRAADLLRDYPNPEAAGVVGRVVSSSSLQMSSYPGRAVRIEGTALGRPMVLIEHAFVVPGRMFLAMVATAPDRELSSDAAEFLDSFKIRR